MLSYTYIHYNEICIHICLIIVVHYNKQKTGCSCTAQKSHTLGLSVNCGYIYKTHTHTQRAQRAGGQRRLIYLDNAIDLSYEPEARKETNCAGQQKEEKYHNCRITKV